MTTIRHLLVKGHLFLQGKVIEDGKPWDILKWDCQTVNEQILKIDETKHCKIRWQIYFEFLLSSYLWWFTVHFVVCRRWFNVRIVSCTHLPPKISSSLNFIFVLWLSSSQVWEHVCFTITWYWYCYWCKLTRASRFKTQRLADFRWPLLSKEYSYMIIIVKC